MAVLSRLDVINEMLASLSESPLNTLDEAHPLVAAGLRMLRIVNTREQSKGWWFNKELVTLPPDEKGYIYTPDDTLRIDPTNTTLNYVQRGRRLYKSFAPATTDSFKFDQPVTCWLVREVPFDDLPASAQLAVSYAAQVDFMRAYDADPLKLKLAISFKSDALIQLNAEHISATNANMLARPGIAAFMADVQPGVSDSRAPYGLFRG